jgi:hypothetical protein
MDVIAWHYEPRKSADERHHKELEMGNLAPALGEIFSCISLARHNVCNISIGGESVVAPVAV